MHRHRLERVVVIDDDFVLRGLMTVKDITRTTEHPLAAKDELGKLRVGAAVGAGDGDEERVAALVQAGVDVIVVDTAHGHTRGRARPRALGQAAISRRSTSSAATSPPARPPWRWSNTAPMA